jgi:secreted PhoX family phosphatase
MYIDRRSLLRAGFLGSSAFLSAHMLWAFPGGRDTISPVRGELVESNLPGLYLPRGFTAREVARSGQPPLAGESFSWHAAPDGGACFGAHDGGWIYVSNSEMDAGQGGASALRFNAQGGLTDAYSILRGSTRNCAGGATPWQTWLSCEEPLDQLMRGMVWECDPFGRETAIPRPALGQFCHEAVAVDPQKAVLYLTEDVWDGCLYRYIPHNADDAGRYNLAQGELQVACWRGSQQDRLQWKTVPDSAARSQPTRYQVAGAARFAGGEGIAWHAGQVYFTTKYDNRLWHYEVSSQQVSILYDDDFFDEPVLRGVDNVTVSCTGEIVVAEDGGDMQLVTVNTAGQVQPLLQLLGHDQSELAGPAFTPAGDRLYVSSQWGESGNANGLGGVTYEISGSFNCS